MPTKAKLGESCLVITQGNHSFIFYTGDAPLYVENDERQEVEMMFLSVMDMFEIAHPELEISGWQIQTSIDKEGDLRYHGVWVHHKPKTTPAPRS